MHTKTLFALALLALFTLAACAPAQATVSAVTPAAGTAALTGTVSAAPQRWKDDEISVYAAPFTATQGEEDGFYMLEPNIHPHAILDKNGAFVLKDVPPGAYVLIVGPNPREGKVVLNSSNHARIFEVQADAVFEAGALAIAP